MKILAKPVVFSAVKNQEIFILPITGYFCWNIKILFDYQFFIYFLLFYVILYRMQPAREYHRINNEDGPVAGQIGQ